MIVFDLLVHARPSFEGWFASGEEFERQQKAKLVRCPVCDDVARRAPAVGAGARAQGRAAVDAPRRCRDAPQEAVAGMPAELVAKLREIVQQHRERRQRFPEEARKIHYEEVPARAIRGQASREEAEALRDEGIEFSPLPPFLTRDTH